MYFDGSDFCLGSFSENIDDSSLLDDGSLLLSTAGRSCVNDFGSFGGEDVLKFKPTTLGNATSGSFEVYFECSDLEPGGFGYWPNVDAVSQLVVGKLNTLTISVSVPTIY